MWNKIAETINNNFHASKTGLQVENRYKTVLKRKKAAVDNNNKSGSSRMNVPYESELHKIAAIDDSVQPEVVGTASGITILKKVSDKRDADSDSSDLPSPNSSGTAKKKRALSVQEVLVEINNQKEEARERRHREKMELIRELFGQRDQS